MKPGELQLGDIVQVGECGRFKEYIAKVIAISSDSNHIGLIGTRAFEEYEEDVLGIPITPEWLKMFGFKLTYDGTNIISFEWRNKEKRETITVSMYRDGKDARFQMTSFPFGAIVSLQSNFKYLHEIQHACRLCRIEINWKL